MIEQRLDRLEVRMEVVEQRLTVLEAQFEAFRRS